ncbi:MAG TPA: head GIN domain-containing protein, partial [Chitinophagaceae bacterium]|nr:head GIN domain-containing protein [Chitinophagaceae bacterium]
IFICAIPLLLGSCIDIASRTVNGNDNMKTEERNVAASSRIQSAGNYDVAIVQGSPFAVKVEADENLLPYIITEIKDGELHIHTREHYNLHSSHKIKVTVTTDKLTGAEIAGSGNIIGEGKFTGGDELQLRIAGSGNINLNVNTPDIVSKIAGSGDIELSGETKNAKIEIAGDGNYKAENLMTETTEIHIAGSGNTRVYAENKLEIHIAGSGDVFYRGNATIEKHVAGSGRIEKIQ